MRYTSVAGVHLTGERLRAWVLGYILLMPMAESTCPESFRVTEVNFNGEPK
jgi:hypothetical protein